jgi:glycerol-3-phosphate dehydrogenase subunit C
MSFDPTPARPPARDPSDPRYWDETDLAGELRRVFDICHNCRMCVNYCGSFPDMFARVDRDIEKRGASATELLTNKDFDSVTDLCWQCKVCYIKCPYTADEGHAWLVDVPRLLARAKALRARRNGITLQDRALGEPQLLGSLHVKSGLSAAGNLVTTNRLLRKVLEKTAGISADFPLPPFGARSFESWLARHEPLAGAGSAGTASVFATCLGDYNFPTMAANAVRVLEKNGFAVVRPEQTCCGMPNLDGGDVEGARAKARRNVASLAAELDAGRTIVALQPTCAYALKKEYPDLLGQSPDAVRVAGAVVDVMELLDRLRRKKTLNTEFTRGLGKVAYHAACHLRAQKIGLPGVRVLGQLPDTEVTVVEQCSAVDGTWGMKAEYYEMGRRYAEKLTRGIEVAEPDLVVTDCQLAGRRILEENEKEALHPVEALARAYGLLVEVS